MVGRTALVGFITVLLAADGERAAVPPRALETAAQRAAQPAGDGPQGDRLGKPVPLVVDGRPLESWGTPFVGDFDGDGRQDLLLGEGQQGRLLVYRNVGT